MSGRNLWIGPGGSDGKESACNAGDLCSIPGSGRSPGEGHGNPLHWRIPWTEEPGGYSPWGCKESDTTEQLTHWTQTDLGSNLDSPVNGYLLYVNFDEIQFLTYKVGWG